ncbi:MAG: thiolase family protein [Novosphingobium sp.]|uniref:thiolase family protein n=1 Tax=Novosphingobium sp. TaxID=1874826 RepID=UPI0027375C86|nr:thiolase family protein [Novosphingobium sp.]MDP3550503.1 thiolase family protein [Novosphingobium sp.]
MKMNAVIAGVGTTRIARHVDRTLSDLAHEAITQALQDAGIDASKIQAVWAGNAAAPVMTGQVCIAGQAILRGLGIGRVPVVNVENACATASTAMQQAAAMVTLGAYDVVLAFGVEKLYSRDKQKVFSVFAGCADVEHPEALDRFILDDGADAAGAGQSRSVFMDVYARLARDYMALSGATARDFAAISAKNSVHGSLNPNAQFRDVLSVDDVLAAPAIIAPLTLTMCSPLADGAAAAVIMSPKAARELGVRSPVKILSSVLASGYDYAEGLDKLTAWTARQAYEAAGVGPADVNCAELHDASSPAEMIYYEALGLCGAGEGVQFLADGHTRIGGRVPVNTSGGLVRKGHPIGATGLSQIHELVLQLRGDAGPRQAEGAMVALAENGGGFLGEDSAAIVVTLLGK